MVNVFNSAIGIMYSCIKECCEKPSAPSIMVSMVTSAQECDATDDDSSNAADTIIKTPVYLNI